MTFGSAQKIERIFCRKSHGESTRFGEADIFAGHAHHAAGEIERVFAGLDHARQPVEGGVRVGIAHGFVQRGDEIEVLFAGFIVAEKFALEDVFEELRGDCADTGFIRLGALGAELEGVVRGAGVAIRERSDAEEKVVARGDALFAKTVLFIGEGAAEKFDDLRSGQRFEDVDLGAREQRRDHFEGRIFRGSADENDMTGFDVGKEGVLLRFVEAVDFVDEDDGAMPAARFEFGGGHDVLDFLDAGQDRAEGDKIGFGEAGNQTGERGFAAAGGAPKKHGAEIVGFDLHAQRLAGAEEFFLADEFVERAGAHAFGERLVGGGVGLGREWGEEAHGGEVSVARETKKINARFEAQGKEGAGGEPVGRRFAKVSGRKDTEAGGLRVRGFGEDVALSGGFVEEDGGGSGGVEGFDAGGHGDAEACVGAALDFFGEAGTFVADEQSDRIAPVYFPGSKRSGFIAVRLTSRRGKSANSGNAKLREKDRQSHAGKNRQMQSGAGGSPERLGRIRAGGPALAGGGSDGGGGSEGGGGAKDGADVAGVLHSRQNGDQRRGAAGRRPDDVIEGSLARFNQSGDALRVLGIGNAFKKRVRGTQNGEGNLFAIQVGRQARMMALAGLAEENGFDAATGAQGLFGQARAFDADAPGFRGQAAAQGHAEFLEPAVVAATDDSGCGAGTRRFGGGGHWS